MNAKKFKCTEVTYILRLVFKFLICMREQKVTAAGTNHICEEQKEHKTECKL